ncbi:putative FERM domain-containing protein FRMD8P1 [Babylonia areolata]|uniref:putative FERM domain-containing protein FRMD8P1 n=1 Tax=Babylonia areolata TaxID=304850 RepID=UPI003FD4E749
MSDFDEEANARQRNEKASLLPDKNQKEPAELVIFLRDRAGIYFHLEDGHLARSDELLELVIEEQGLPQDAKEVFSLWFVSPILDIRMKGHHQPFQIIQQWDQLCSLYTDAKNDEIRDSEPVLMLQRDVFYPKDQEVFVTNEQMLCLLYHEAKFNVVQGRYALYMEDYHRLAGLQALIHLGKYNRQTHMLADYRASLMQFYPEHMYVKERFLFFARTKPQARDCEELFMDAHKKTSEEYADLDIDKSLSILYRKYLEVCWTYPFYGAAFFSGQVETPTGRLKKLILPPADTEVWVAINMDCVTIVDRARCELLLSIPFAQLSWEFRDPDFDGDNDPPPCLFLQFLSSSASPSEGGGSNNGGSRSGINLDPEEAEGVTAVTKLLKIYSREAKLMDALIDTCVRRKLHQRLGGVNAAGMDFVDSGLFDSSSRKILNKLERLCLSTFTKQGDKLEAE